MLSQLGFTTQPPLVSLSSCTNNSAFPCYPLSCTPSVIVYLISYSAFSFFTLMHDFPRIYSYFPSVTQNNYSIILNSVFVYIINNMDIVIFKLCPMFLLVGSLSLLEVTRNRVCPFAEPLLLLPHWHNSMQCNWQNPLVLHRRID